MNHFSPSRTDKELEKFIHLVEILIEDVKKCQKAFRAKYAENRHENEVTLKNSSKSGNFLEGVSKFLSSDSDSVILESVPESEASSVNGDAEPPSPSQFCGAVRKASLSMESVDSEYRLDREMRPELNSEDVIESRRNESVPGTLNQLTPSPRKGHSSLSPRFLKKSSSSNGSQGGSSQSPPQAALKNTGSHSNNSPRGSIGSRNVKIHPGPAAPISGDGGGKAPLPAPGRQHARLEEYQRKTYQDLWNLGAQSGISEETSAPDDLNRSRSLSSNKSPGGETNSTPKDSIMESLSLSIDKYTEGSDEAKRPQRTESSLSCGEPLHSDRSTDQLLSNSMDNFSEEKAQDALDRSSHGDGRRRVSLRWGTTLQLKRTGIDSTSTLDEDVPINQPFMKGKPRKSSLKGIASKLLRAGSTGGSPALNKKKSPKYVKSMKEVRLELSKKFSDNLDSVDSSRSLSRQLSGGSSVLGTARRWKRQLSDDTMSSVLETARQLKRQLSNDTLSSLDSEKTADSVKSVLGALMVKIKKPKSQELHDTDDLDQELQMMDRHEVEAETDDEDKSPFLIPGNSVWWITWERWMILITAIAIIVTTMQAAFARGETVLSSGVMVMLKLIDVLFFLDLLVRFRVTYICHNTQREVFDEKLIAQHYFQTNFIIQLMAAVPVNLVVLGNGKSLVVEHWWLCFFRFPNLFDVLIRDTAFEMVLQDMPMVYRAFKMVFIFFLIMHMMACSYWYNSETTEFSTDMSPPQRVVDNKLGVQYNHAVMKCLLVLSASDLIAETENEHYFMLLGLFIAFLVNGVLIGSFSNLLSEDGTMAERKKQAQGLQNFMREMRIPKKLQKMITEYLDYQWDLGQNQYMQSMFDELPAKLKMGLDIQLQRTFVEKTPLMKALPSVGVLTLMSFLTPRLAPHGELIICQGEIGHSMYFISSGCVRVYLGGDGGPTTYLISLGSGNQFGEIALIRNCLRTANCRAVKFSELFELGNEGFWSFCSMYPAFEQMMSYLTQSRLRITRSVQDAQKLKSKLGFGKEKSVHLSIFHRKMSFRHNTEQSYTIGENNLSRFSSSQGFSRKFPVIAKMRTMASRMRLGHDNDTEHSRKYGSHGMKMAWRTHHRGAIFYKTLNEAEHMSMSFADNADYSTADCAAQSFFKNTGSKLDTLEAASASVHLKSPEKDISFFHGDEDVTINMNNSSSMVQYKHSQQKLFLERTRSKPLISDFEEEEPQISDLTMLSVSFKIPETSLPNS